MFNFRNESNHFQTGRREVLISLKGLTGDRLRQEIEQRRKEIALLDKYSDDTVKARVVGMRQALSEVIGEP